MTRHLLFETRKTPEIIARGLSMPHLPRWHHGRLWVLHAEMGGLGTIDLATVRYESLVEFSGFTCGLCFVGPSAFVELSQLRETAVFSGIPIAERPDTERLCGVWIVNIETGEIVAWVKFADSVQEVFAVKVLPNAKLPDINTDDREFLSGSYILPDSALADVPNPTVTATFP